VENIFYLISIAVTLARALATRAAVVVQTTAFTPRPSGGGSIRRKALQMGFYPPPVQLAGFYR